MVLTAQRGSRAKTLGFQDLRPGQRVVAPASPGGSAALRRYLIVQLPRHEGEQSFSRLTVPTLPDRTVNCLIAG